MNIQTLIEQIETVHKVRVLYIAECGSRAWGYDCPNSDHDLRFCYYRIPWERDLLDTDSTIRVKVGNIDAQGFELAYCFRKLAMQNFTVVEMVESPFIYSCSANVQLALRWMQNHYYSPYKMFCAMQGLGIQLSRMDDAKSFQIRARIALIADDIYQGKMPELSLCGHDLVSWVGDVRDLRNGINFEVFKRTGAYADAVRFIEYVQSLQMNPTAREQRSEFMKYANQLYKGVMYELLSEIHKIGTNAVSSSVVELA